MQVSLSFDSLAGGNADMFRMLRFTADVAWLGGNSIANQRLLELATIDGAGALGLADVTGMVTPARLRTSS